MPAFKDHFSGTAATYAAYRPTYPAALFRWLAARSPGRIRAWDCGCGSGQAAVALADHFEVVIASDASKAQLASAHRGAGVYYAAMTAEDSALADRSVQLVTVAQALHWFDQQRFHAELRRVLTEGGVVAAWTYGLLTVDGEVDGLIRQFYRNDIGPYWPAERAIVDAGYGSLPFPFRELEAPAFAMEADWTLDQLAGYLRSWSGVSRYVSVKGVDPVPAFVDALRPRWGPAGTIRRIRWPLELRVGLV
jgi:SAM-dependent methyltransferase